MLQTAAKRPSPCAILTDLEKLQEKANFVLNKSAGVIAVMAGIEA